MSQHNCTSTVLPSEPCNQLLLITSHGLRLATWRKVDSRKKYVGWRWPRCRSRRLLQGHHLVTVPLVKSRLQLLLERVVVRQIERLKYISTCGGKRCTKCRFPGKVCETPCPGAPYRSQTRPYPAGRTASEVAICERCWRAGLEPNSRSESWRPRCSIVTR